MGHKDIKKAMKLALGFLPDKAYLSLYYFLGFKRRCNFEDPQSFNEKMQWLKLYDRKEEYIPLVDKYEVRKHIAEAIGEEYLVPLVGGPWDRVEDIDFDSLPDQFVLKCTHDSGGLVICKDKSKLNINAARRKIKSAMNCNYYLIGREWPYKDVKPRIIAEQYLEDESQGELRDYKFMCFNGEVKCSFICSDRYSDDGLHVTFFDRDWQVLPFIRHYPAYVQGLPKPLHYEKMIELSEKLAQQLPFVRVDFYEVNGKPYIGELTLYPGSGMEKFSPEEWDYKLGSWLQLPLPHKHN